MKVVEMFEKDITRDIKGVIKVGQSNEENVYQELEEYVVTKQLLKHFRSFFENYEKGINASTDKMGVWISGFFGSGKSHFLKILSYLLKNSEVEGKKAIEYFTDGRKIEDQVLIAQMNKSSNISSDVMLFNIDSKGSAKVGSGKEAIVEVFLKVFNEMQGYCSTITYLADFERQLDKDGMYDKFKEAFKNITNATWEEKRNAFVPNRRHVVKALVDIGYCNEDDAQTWCKDLKKDHKISIEEFANMVKEYCDSKGPNHHVIFMVDEIGQYIADDSSLMLNLQTIVEDLGTACYGRAWVIVTSQEDIDSITKTMGNDFSKIQGRFNTTLSLSAANVDEVIRKRILKKNETARQTLELLYDEKESIIKNLITFTGDTADRKLYTDKSDFSNCYPFIPYQFTLLGEVLSSIRKHGASGKHLSDQSRSMLALCQESALKIKNCDEGKLIPFSYFYDPLANFIDHQHSQVISSAEANDRLDEFDVELLKVLFMIKYVKEIKANIDNLTTLMISNIDDDRVQIRSKIEESLDKLEKQTLIQKNGEIYIFLTNEEQDINNAIKKVNVERSEVIKEVSNVIFQVIYKVNKYKYSNRYLFPFYRKVDEKYFADGQNMGMGLVVLTPYSDMYIDEKIRTISTGTDAVYMKLPNDITFLEEVREMLQISKYLVGDGKDSFSREGYESIKRAKEDEKTQKNDRVKTFLEDALKNADIFLKGNDVQISKSSDVVTRMDNALKLLVENTYNNLNHMETAPAKVDMLKVLEADNRMDAIGISDNISNKLAVDDVYRKIYDYSKARNKLTIKSLIDIFEDAPYGFVQDDVCWLIAVLLKQGRITLNYNSENISLIGRDSNEILKYITNREYIQKVIVDIKYRASDRQIRDVKEILKDYLGYTCTSEDDEVIMKNFKSRVNDKLDELNETSMEYRIEARYPGIHYIENACSNLNKIKGIKSSIEFFKEVSRMKENLLDDAEDVKPVLDFFKSEQKNIFEKALRNFDVFEESKNYVTDKEVIDIFNQIKDIVKDKKPFGRIRLLPDLNSKFTDKFGDLAEKIASEIKQAVEVDKKMVLEEVVENGLVSEFNEQFINRFNELLNKLDTTNNIATINSVRVESQTVRQDCLDKVAEYINAHQAKEESTEESIPPTSNGQEESGVHKSDDNYNKGLDVKPQVKARKKKKYVSMNKITGSQAYKIESREDIDKFLSGVKERLIKELEEDTIITLN